MTRLLLLTDGTATERSVMADALKIAVKREETLPEISSEGSFLTPARLNERAALMTDLLKEILSRGVPHGGINE